MDKREFLLKTNLYVILDCRLVNYQEIENITEKIISGGAKLLQLRYKDIITREYFRIAEKLQKICSTRLVKFIVNDDVAVAKAVDADGVHVGQEDLPLQAARKIMGEDKIIGVSAHTDEDAYIADKNGADYIGVGSVFQTQTKENAEVCGIDYVQYVKENVRIPVYAIGGINTANVINLRNAGVYKAAVSSAIMTSKDPEKTVEKFISIIGN
ncbi:thiamine phosphate synthase [bacterium]|nr:thiamine phosphate synthase [bacterium]